MQAENTEVKQLKAKGSADPSLGNLGFPVFALCHDASTGCLFVAGGGGNSKSGVKNSIACFDADQKFKFVHYLPQDTGAVMNMCVKNGILACGIDAHMWVFQCKDKLEKHAQVQTDFKEAKSKYDESYQKVVRTNGTYLVTGGTDKIVRMWSVKDTKELVHKFKEHTDEINDLDIDNSHLVTLSSEKFVIRQIDDDGKFTTLHEIDLAKLNDNQGSGKFSFRFCRIGGIKNIHQVYTVHLSPERWSYLTVWDLKTGMRMRVPRLIVKKAVTVMAMNIDGTLMAFGTADGGVCVHDTALKTNRMWMRQNAHGFTVTALDFSANSKKLVSGSADYTCRVHDATQKPGLLGRLDWTTVLALIVLLIAYLWLQTNFGRSK